MSTRLIILLFILISCTNNSVNKAWDSDFRKFEHSLGINNTAALNSLVAEMDDFIDINYNKDSGNQWQTEKFIKNLEDCILNQEQCNWYFE